MKNTTKFKLVFTSLALPLSLAISGCGHNPPQTDSMTSNSVITNAMDHRIPSPMGHMESNSMHMADSSMNKMATNDSNMAHSPQTAHMMSGSMTASNQSQMNDLTTNSMHKMAAAQTGNLESH